MNRTAEFESAVALIRTIAEQGAAPVAFVERGASTEEASPFSRAARDILLTIKEMKRTLDVAASAYIGVAGTGVSESERDDLEAEVVHCASECKARINGLVAMLADGHALNGSVLEHYHAVVASLWERLERTTRILQEQKIARARIATLALHRLSSVRLGLRDGGRSKLPAVQADAWESSLSPDEARKLEAENQALTAELSSGLDDVREMEQKMVEVSTLLQEFSLRVMEQRQQVESIRDHASTTREHIAKANEQLGQASQRSLGFRLVVFILLIVASALLLLLDHFS